MGKKQGGRDPFTPHERAAEILYAAEHFHRNLDDVHSRSHNFQSNLGEVPLIHGIHHLINNIFC